MMSNDKRLLKTLLPISFLLAKKMGYKYKNMIKLLKQD